MDVWCPCISIVTSDFKQLTTANRCPSTPTFVGHAGYSAGSYQGISSVAAVGHCWLKGCTRATSLTICRSIRGRTTAYSWSKETGTTFAVATMQVRTSQTKRQAEMLTDILSMGNRTSTSTIYLTKLHKDAFTVHNMRLDTIVGRVQLHTSVCVQIPTIMAECMLRY